MTKTKSLWLLLMGLAVLSGCIRLSGSAGYWKQGSEDDAPEIHQAGFDTAQLVAAKPKS